MANKTASEWAKEICDMPLPLKGGKKIADVIAEAFDLYLLQESGELVRAIEQNGRCSLCGGTGKAHMTSEGISRRDTPCWKCPESFGLATWAFNAINTFRSRHNG